MSAIPTSGGRAKTPFATDHTNDQGSKRLYLGKAFENAQHLSFNKTKGNSVGRAEVASKTTTGTVSKAAKSRVGRKS